MHGAMAAPTGAKKATQRTSASTMQTARVCFCRWAVWTGFLCTLSHTAGHGFERRQTRGEGRWACTRAAGSANAQRRREPTASQGQLGVAYGQFTWEKPRHCSAPVAAAAAMLPTPAPSHRRALRTAARTAAAATAARLTRSPLCRKTVHRSIAAATHRLGRHTLSFRGGWPAWLCPGLRGCAQDQHFRP